MTSPLASTAAPNKQGPLFVGAGAMLIVAGLAWIGLRRRQGSCGCQKEPTIAPTPFQVP